MWCFCIQKDQNLRSYEATCLFSFHTLCNFHFILFAKSWSKLSIRYIYLFFFLFYIIVIYTIISMFEMNVYVTFSVFFCIYHQINMIKWWCVERRKEKLFQFPFSYQKHVFVSLPFVYNMCKMLLLLFIYYVYIYNYIHVFGYQWMCDLTIR